MGQREGHGHGGQRRGPGARGFLNVLTARVSSHVKAEGKQPERLHSRGIQTHKTTLSVNNLSECWYLKSTGEKGCK